MPDSQPIARDIRERLLTKPEIILEDRDLMRALVSRHENAMGENIVDMRGLAMERLEERLARLEETHATVLAVAYDNLSGMHTVHRAVLRLLECRTMEEFLNALRTDVATCVRVEGVRLILETTAMSEAPALKQLGDIVFVAEEGFSASYAGRDPADKPVMLREVMPGHGGLYGARAEEIQSEALLRVDLGPNRLPGMLALGSIDAGQFRPGHGTDLLAFFGGVIERAMRRWLD